MRNLNRQRLAFTLVELMVVVSILAILVSTLLPAIKKAREAAVGVQCIGNLHQLSLGLEQYAIDYGMAIPVETSYATSASDGRSWTEFLLGTFVKTTYIASNRTRSRSGGSTALSCPKMDSNILTTLSGSPSSLKVVDPGTYGMLHPQHVTGNYFITYSNPASTTWISFDGVRLTSVPKRSDFGLVFDTSSGGLHGSYLTTGSSDWFTDRVFTGYLGPQGIWLAHNGRANGIFADFHVEACDPGRLRTTFNDNFNGGHQTHGISAWKDANFKSVVVSLPY